MRTYQRSSQRRPGQRPDVGPQPSSADTRECIDWVKARLHALQGETDAPRGSREALERADLKYRLTILREGGVYNLRQRMEAVTRIRCWRRFPGTAAYLCLCEFRAKGMVQR